MSDSGPGPGEVQVEGELDIAGRAYTKPPWVGEGETKAVVDSDGGGREMTEQFPDCVDESELTDLQTEIIKQAALHQDATHVEVAKTVDTSERYVREVIGRFWPERSPGQFGVAAEAVSAQECARIRATLLAGDRSTRDFDRATGTVTKHANGGCEHQNINHPPLKYDQQNGEWVISDRGGSGAVMDVEVDEIQPPQEPETEWVDIDGVDLDTLDTLGIEYETREQVRVLEGDHAE